MTDREFRYLLDLRRYAQAREIDAYTDAAIARIARKRASNDAMERLLARMKKAG